MHLQLRAILKIPGIIIFLKGMVLLFLPLSGRAQDSCKLRISLLTCGTGQDLYSVYGHSAIRVVDSCSGTDLVYNYGTFNFGDPDFYLNFTRGKLLYYLNDELYEGFLQQYESEQRSVYEQVLELGNSDAKAIKAFLTHNLLEENKYYKYDFLFDNCSTRIRDLFANLFKNRIIFHRIISNDSVSFRAVLNYYERNIHWERTGINLLMSDVVDRKMKSEESMFLPDYLMKGFGSASLDGKSLVRETRQILPQGVVPAMNFNEPKVYFWILTAILLLLSFFKIMKTPMMFLDTFFFLILGLLGILILFMWLGTEHKVCAWNRNLLWAFPLHLVFAFLIPRQSPLTAKYARYAGWLLIGSLFYNIVAEQKYIAELIPLMILTLFRLNHYSRQVKFHTF